MGDRGVAALAINSFCNYLPLDEGDLSPVEVHSAFSVLLNGYGFFAVPPIQPDFTPFIHIRTREESNKLTLNVGNGGQGVLRINDEIAWEGIVPSAYSAIIWRSDTAQFTLERVALYAPSLTSPATIPR